MASKYQCGENHNHNKKHNHEHKFFDTCLYNSHSMGLVLSALYAKLLVVMGMAFPLSEVMSTYIPAAYYDVRVLFRVHSCVL